MRLLYVLSDFGFRYYIHTNLKIDVGYINDRIPAVGIYLHQIKNVNFCFNEEMRNVSSANFFNYFYIFSYLLCLIFQIF